MGHTDSLAPSHRTDLITRTIDHELVVMDPERGFVHHLNPSAAAIWCYCDGTKSTGQLAEAFAADVGRTPGEVLGDVINVIAEFERLGLLSS